MQNRNGRNVQGYLGGETLAIHVFFAAAVLSNISSGLTTMVPQTVRLVVESGTTP